MARKMVSYFNHLCNDAYIMLFSQPLSTDFPVVTRSCVWVKQKPYILSGDCFLCFDVFIFSHSALGLPCLINGKYDELSQQTQIISFLEQNQSRIRRSFWQLFLKLKVKFGTKHKDYFQTVSQTSIGWINTSNPAPN